MQKRALIILIVVVLAAMFIAGGVVFIVNLKIKNNNQKILKTETNGIIFETIGYSERNDLQLIDDKYKYSLITKVELSITNTNLTPVSFQAKSLNVRLKDGYWFYFNSVKNTATSEIISDKNDMITIPAGSQIIFEFVFRDGEGSNVGSLSGNEEQMKASINHSINNEKDIFGNKTEFSLLYLSTVISKGKIGMNYFSAETLIDYVNGRATF